MFGGVTIESRATNVRERAEEGLTLTLTPALTLIIALTL